MHGQIVFVGGMLLNVLVNGNECGNAREYTAQGCDMHVNACFDVLEVHNLIWNQMGVHGQVVDMHVVACFCLV